MVPCVADNPPVLDISSLNLVDLLLDALCIVEADSRIVFVSPAFERIFGYTPQEAKGLRMLDLVHPDDRDTTAQQAQSVMQGQLQLEFENRYIRKDGRIAHIRWTARRAEGSNLRVAMAHDITERKNLSSMQAAMYAISEVAHATHDLSVLFARVHTIVGELLASQDLAVVLYDHTSRQLTYPYPPRDHDTAVPIDDDPLCARVLQSGEPVLDRGNGAPGAGSARFEPEGFTSGGERYWLGVPLQGAQGPIGVLVLQGNGPNVQYTPHDQRLLQFVSAQVASAIESTQMRARLIQMSQFDALTGLPNRLLLHDRLAGALCRARRGGSGVSLLFVDLDRFKQVNDTLGHAAGDMLLRQVGERLNSCLRGSDTVARIGGDEFVLLLEGSPAEGHAPRAVQSKIAEAFAAPFLLGSPATQVTVQVSMGLARFPEDGLDEEALLRFADAAMYADKLARQ